MSTQVESNTQLVGVWVWVGRGVWIVLAVICLVYLVYVCSLALQQPLADCLAQNADCNPIELSANDLVVMRDSRFPVQLVLTVSRSLGMAANAVFVIAAFLIFWRKSSDWVALLVSGTLLGLGAIGFSPDPLNALAELPVLDWLTTAIALVCYILPMMMLFFFPDGRWIPRWSWYLVATLAIATIFYGAAALKNISLPDGVYIAYFVAVAISTVIGIGCVVYRYRRIADQQQQQQLKWVAFGLLCATAIVLMWFVYAAVFPPERPSPTRTFALLIGYLFLFPLMSLFPICVMIAVLRYRLFDIDIIIRRTLVYSVLSGLLALTYFGSVIVLQSIFRAFTGQGDNQLVTVISTLTIAALFNPLRRRVQSLIDRRFYRRKYDSAKTLATFAATARDEVDLDALTAELLRVVEETMQPAHVSLWLSQIPERGRTSEREVKR